MGPSKEIATFTPGQAREILDAVKMLRSAGTIANLSMLSKFDEPATQHVIVRNRSGEVVPAFACMQVTGTESEGLRTVVYVTKPDKKDGRYLFNHDRPIRDDAYGMALPWGVVRMLADKDDEPDIEKEYGPTVGDWKIEEQDGGPFVAFGRDEIAEDVWLGRIGSSGLASSTSIIQFALTGDSGDEYDDYGYEDEESCENKVVATEYYGEVTKVACGASRPVPYEDYEGIVPLADDLGILKNRDVKELAGKVGLAVLLKDEESDYGECYWCIVYIDFHRDVQVVTDVIFRANEIVIERKLLSVWDDCNLPEEIIEGADCDEESDDYGYGGGI